MPTKYYELPINFSSLMQKNNELAACDLKKSIAQNIYLIITSRFRENRFDDSYGCELWDMDFELVHNESLRRRNSEHYKALLGSYGIE